MEPVDPTESSSGSWWDEGLAQEGKAEGIKWRTLSHNGVLFPPPYVPHGIPVIYEGLPITLTPEQEEVATFYARYIDTEHTRKPVFKKNFFSDWLKLLNPPSSTSRHPITDLDKCDFSLICRHLHDQLEAKRNRSKADKAAEKEHKAQIQQRYGIAIVDGRKEKVANFMVEPPGLFLGRGEHPSSGRYKRRVQPEDVTLNLSEGAPVPTPPVAGHSWKQIIHNPSATFLAYWQDNVTRSMKYVWLAPSSNMASEAQRARFDKARALGPTIAYIRAVYESELTSDDRSKRQRATALWLIDHMALRVEGEADDDTVGCASLRVQHIMLTPPCTLTLDFIGKGSLRYFNTVQVDPRVWNNISKFVQDKPLPDLLFESISADAMRAYMESLHPALTASLLRVFNASLMMQRELDTTSLKLTSLEEKILKFNHANMQVAILLCHQRSTPPPSDTKKIAATLEKKKTPTKPAREVKTAQRVLRSGRVVTYELKDECEREPPASRSRDNVGEVEAKTSKLDLKSAPREEQRTLALGTAKMNYIDPRITIAWSKRLNVPLERLYPRSLMEKFRWALDVDPEWHY